MFFNEFSSHYSIILYIVDITVLLEVLYAEEFIPVYMLSLLNLLHSSVQLSRVDFNLRVEHKNVKKLLKFSRITVFFNFNFKSYLTVFKHVRFIKMGF